MKSSPGFHLQRMIIQTLRRAMEKIEFLVIEPEVNFEINLYRNLQGSLVLLIISCFVFEAGSMKGRFMGKIFDEYNFQILYFTI